jgi:hypothetical protein
MSAEQAALLVSFETGAKEATRARDLEEVNASIEDYVKELSREQVAVDERGHMLMDAEQ